MADENYPGELSPDPNAEPKKEPEKKAKGEDWEKLAELGKKKFKAAMEREAKNRADYVDDVKFGRLGGNEQWPPEIVTQRTDAGKPCLTINMMPSFIHQVINDTRQNKPAISVRPVDSGADRQTALVLAGGIRHIESNSHADVAYDTCVDCSASGGFGYMRLVIDYTHDDSFDKEIYIRAVPDPLTILGDPTSMSADSLDWNDAFVLEWKSEEQFKQDHPGAEVINFDQSDAEHWRRTDEVLECEWWHRTPTEKEIVLLSNGWVIDADEYEEQKELFDAQLLTEKERRTAKSFKVCQYIMTGAGIIEEEEWPGKYIPIVPCYGEEVVVEGKRHFRSLIRDGKDPQRNFNYWRSKAAESAAASQQGAWVGPESAFTGEYKDRWNTPGRKWPFYAYNDDAAIAPQWVNLSSADPAAMQQAASAADDMNRTLGMYKASLGAPSNETSGRAINARKVEGDTGTFHFPDNLSRSIRCLGVNLIDVMPHVYTPGRWLRVLGVDGKEGHVQIAEKAKMPQPPMADQPAAPGVGGAPMAPTPKPEDHPEIDYGAVYDISLGKYDVIVQAGPGYTTKREQAADQMMQMVQSFPQLGALVGDLIAENLDWPGADQFAKRIRAMLPPQIKALLDSDGQSEVPPQLLQQINQGKQLIQQLYQALQKALGELQQAKEGNDLEAQKNQIAQMANAVDMFNAQTDRMEAELKRGQMQLDAMHTAITAAQPAARPQVYQPGM